MPLPTTTDLLPTAQARPTPPSIANASTGDGTAVIWKRILANVNWRQLYSNPNAAIGENVGNLPGVGIISGLAITLPGSGLSLPVSAGKANLGSPVEWNGTTMPTPLPDNSSPVFIWFKSDGTLTYTTTTTPPAGVVCFLGTASTNGGNITAIDPTNGVVRFRTGLLYRKSGDTGAPLDSPPSTVILLAETLGGFYLWTGSVWLPLTGNLPANLQTVPAGGTSLVALGYQAFVFDRYTVRGLAQIRGLLKVRRI